ncbi:MAG: hypothetical protein M1828_002364 [Chrysothrix sp. TS-e1954]|nr:MAG: hypothetical protein M1828_002364 [Chrysothrix sp. TS-e1954]
MASPTATLPSRTRTDATDDDVPFSEDTSEVTKLFQERLQAWKHACRNLEEYITSTEKMQAAHSKEYEKVLKTVSSPLKEGHHFDQNLGGISEMFEHIRTNTQGISNHYSETAKALKGTVLPIFERLHAEIKNKQKELDKGVGKSSKSVDKARQATDKHVGLLGQHAAAAESPSSKLAADKDPYVLQKGVYHRLNKQIQEENNTRQDTLSVQNSFSQFEAHVVQVLQQGMGQFNQTMTFQLDTQKNMYANMAQYAGKMDPMFEWNGFVQRNQSALIDPNAGPRNINSVNFPNQDHRATQPLIQGSLERKSGMLKRFDAGFYVVTPSKFLHQFKTDDNLSKDPAPEMSLFLPECSMGALDGTAFNIKGKDSSGGKVGSALSTQHEYAFKAHTPTDAEKWYNVIAGVIGTSTGSVPGTPSGSAVNSPTSGEGSYPFSRTTTGGDRNVSGSTQGTMDAGVTSSTAPSGTTMAGSNTGTATNDGVQGKPGQY